MEQAPKQAPKPAAAKPKGKKKDEAAELVKSLCDSQTAEDKELKEQLELLVTRAQDVDAGIQHNALEMIQEQIRTSTSSMTSVPKPLKFLAPHYSTLTEAFEKAPAQNKEKFADVLSFLSMTMNKSSERSCLKYKLAGSLEALTAWGHEFVRFLCCELGDEFHARKEANAPVDDLMQLVDQIIPFHMKHNAEPDACDLLMEVEALSNLVQFVDLTNYERVSLYLTQCANYVPAEERSSILAVILDIYQKLDKKPDALRIALKLDDLPLINRIWESAEDGPVKKQLAFMLARQQILPENIESVSEEYVAIVRNTSLSQYFLDLARNLDIMEPKEPEDIYKSHLTEGRTTGVDSARGNLASTFVNAFVNAGFGKDNLISGENGGDWIFKKNNDHGKISATASLGMVMLWNVDEGLDKLDKYQYAAEDQVKAGALIGIGLVNANVRSEVEPAWALLVEHITSNSGLMQTGALMGLALAYAGTNYEELREAVLPVVKDPKYSMEIVGLAALCLGLTFVGTGNEEISQGLLSTLLARDEASLANTNFRFLCLGLGLLHFGRGDAAAGLVEELSAVKGNVAKYAQMTLLSCAFAGTGNVLQIQKMLHECAEHLTENAAHQSIAAFGIALIALGEDLGTEMASRTFDHLLQYGELPIRRAVPLGLAVLHVSNPDVPTTDMLSKLSHDHDAETAQAAILALGIIGAGTNNSRIAGLLRNLSTYNYKEPNHLYMVRLAQALLHMGKGTMTLNPFHSAGVVLNKVALASIICILHSCLDLKNLLLGTKHYLFYLLTLAMQPRMLMTFDEELKPLEVSVRVGQAVDTVGQAGKPKTITGFQTHTTPVLIGQGERAELATEDYVALSANGALEGFVVLKKAAPQ